MSDVSGPSTILLEELFQAADDRFLVEFQRFNSYDFLLKFVDRWVRDARPWARQQIVNYTRLDWNLPGHAVVVKRLFKHFEQKNDHELLACFMVAFDRLVRRVRVTRYQYDRSTRQSWQEEFLYAKPNKTIVNETNRISVQKWAGKTYRNPLPDLRNKPDNRLFTHATRNYLRRRVWRYFRFLSYSRPDEYVRAIARALKAYRDSDFAEGENILDNWCLMHACYFHHDGLLFNNAHTNLAEGHSLGQLSAKPYQPTAWKSETGAEALIELISTANSSLVRLWAMELLQREHREAINRIDVRELIAMLSHADPRVQEFAADLFREHKSLATLRIETWLELLEQSNPTVLTLICTAMQKHVSIDRLDNGQMIALTCARPVSVARMGLEMLKQRHQQRPLAADQISHVASAACLSLSGEITQWALSQIAQDQNYDLNAVIEFFDALLVPARRAAMDWLDAEASPGYNDPALWARLVETPFDDVKIHLIESLQRRLSGGGSIPGQSTNEISQIWAAVILGVHRGGRTKLKAVHQVADAIAKETEQAEKLLPVLAVAVRSVRAPERRNALSAVATLAARHTDLEQQIQSHLPELAWVRVSQETGR
jgi:hypothetical protein